jgi:hypothetical protein
LRRNNKRTDLRSLPIDDTGRTTLATVDLGVAGTAIVRLIDSIVAIAVILIAPVQNNEAVSSARSPTAALGSIQKRSRTTKGNDSNVEGSIPSTLPFAIHPTSINALTRRTVST